MATKVYSSKCKWCGVTVDAKEPVTVCECCGSNDIVSTSYFIDGELPKTHKEQKAEAKKAATERCNKIVKFGLIAVGSLVSAAALATALSYILRCL